MAGTGSHEPHIVRSGRKVPQRIGDVVRLEALKAEADRRGQPQASRVKPFPQRAATSTPEAASSPSPTGPVVQDQQPLLETATFVETTFRQAKPVSPTGVSLMQAVLQTLARATRLTADATLILLFSPVIAVWWLLERRHRKGGR